MNDFNWRIIDGSFEKIEPKQLKITYVNVSNECGLCSKMMSYDQTTAMKVCTNCGFCYSDQPEGDIDYNKYFETHRKKTLKKYYKKDGRLFEMLNQCKEMKMEHKLSVLKLFELNKRTIEKVYYYNSRNNLNYVYIINKLLNMLNLGQYCKYFPVSKSKQTLKKSNRIWKLLEDRFIRR